MNSDNVVGTASESNLDTFFRRRFNVFSDGPSPFPFPLTAGAEGSESRLRFFADGSSSPFVVAGGPGATMTVSAFGAGSTSASPDSDFDFDAEFAFEPVPPLSPFFAFFFFFFSPSPAPDPLTVAEKAAGTEDSGTGDPLTGVEPHDLIPPLGATVFSPVTPAFLPNPLPPRGGGALALNPPRPRPRENCCGLGWLVGADSRIWSREGWIEDVDAAGASSEGIGAGGASVNVAAGAGPLPWGSVYGTCRR
jgi:hypothetical protein